MGTHIHPGVVNLMHGIFSLICKMMHCEQRWHTGFGYIYTTTTMFKPANAYFALDMKHL